MKYNLFGVQRYENRVCVYDERIFVYADNENKARDILIDNLEGDDFQISYLGWCTKEVADEQGYMVYAAKKEGMTIKDFYEWAVANKVENHTLRALDKDFGTYRKIDEDDIDITELTKTVYLF